MDVDSLGHDRLARGDDEEVRLVVGSVVQSVLCETTAEHRVTQRLHQILLFKRRPVYTLLCRLPVGDEVLAEQLRDGPLKHVWRSKRGFDNALRFWKRQVFAAVEQQRVEYSHAVPRKMPAACGKYEA